MTQSTTPRANTPGRTMVQGGQTNPVVLPPSAPPPPEGAVVVGVPASFPGNPNDVPEGAIIISVAFFVTVAVIAIGWPLARAFGRRMDRGAVAPPPALSREMGDRMVRIENAVESIAIEIERISEGQRFTTKLLSERNDAAMLERRTGAGS